MVVDDSAVIRGMLTRTLESDPMIGVVATVANGQAALLRIKRGGIEVVVLDIEMPVMDGMTALPLLLKAAPEIKIIMASTLTRKNAAISMQALARGASDFVTKPSASSELHSANDFGRELIDKVKALGATVRRPCTPGRPVVTSKGDAGQRGGPAAPRDGLYGTAPIVLREPPKTPPRVVAFGSSTGGPQALFKLFEQLRDSIALPILITQHMPATFTTILAEHLQRVSGVTCEEGVDGEPVRDGRMYLAPGGFHMTVARDGPTPVIRLNTDPPENFCRPAVDPMLRSVAQIYGGRSLAVILTGMGHDGLKGGQAIVDARGTVIAQDEATSVVWGMPGAVATGGLCSAVLSLESIVMHLKKITREAQP